MQKTSNTIVFFVIGLLDVRGEAEMKSADSALDLLGYRYHSRILSHRVLNFCEAQKHIRMAARRWISARNGVVFNEIRIASRLSPLGFVLFRCNYVYKFSVARRRAADSSCVVRYRSRGALSFFIRFQRVVFREHA